MRSLMKTLKPQTVEGKSGKARENTHASNGTTCKTQNRQPAIGKGGKTRKAPRQFGKARKNPKTPMGKKAGEPFEPSPRRARQDAKTS